jgi:hypothetical protein
VSTKILAEVWDHPTGSCGDMLVLLRLADSASEATRMSWESGKTLAKKTRLSERQVFRCLKRLEDRRIIEIVPDDEVPEESRKYTSVVRRITPVEAWDDVIVTNDHDNMSVGIPTDIEITSCVTNVIQPLTTNRSISSRLPVKTSSLQYGPRKRGRTQKPLPEEDPMATALADLVDPEEDPQPDKDPHSPRKRKRSTSQGEDLAEYFKRLALANSDTIPGETNVRALQGSFNTWINDGQKYVVIQGMIERYWSPVFKRSEVSPAWQDFLARRGELYHRQKKVQAAADVEANRHNPERWSGPKVENKQAQWWLPLPDAKVGGYRKEEE